MKPMHWSTISLISKIYHTIYLQSLHFSLIRFFWLDDFFFFNCFHIFLIKSSLISFFFPPLILSKTIMRSFQLIYNLLFLNIWYYEFFLMIFLAKINLINVRPCDLCGKNILLRMLYSSTPIIYPTLSIIFLYTFKTSFNLSIDSSKRIIISSNYMIWLSLSSDSRLETFLKM
jgi:hypothetical protein